MNLFAIFARREVELSKEATVIKGPPKATRRLDEAPSGDYIGKWRATIAGTPNGLIVAQAPNRAHRWMWLIFFGVRWTKFTWCSWGHKATPAPPPLKWWQL